MSHVRAILAIFGATTAALALAWDPPPPPAADPYLTAPPTSNLDPTAYACTAETLVSGKDCIFEGEPSAALPADAAKLAQGLCARAARRAAVAAPDPAVLAICRRDVESTARSCLGDQPAVDREDRFLPAARACYAAIQATLAGVNFMAAVTSECCRCASESGCAASAEACNRAAARGRLERAACVIERCMEPCKSLLPSKGSEPESAPLPAPGSTRPVDLPAAKSQRT